MIKDQSPKYNLGYGISPSAIPLRSDADGMMRQGPSPHGGIIAKALNGHPILRFFSAAAGAMLGMHIASSLVERGGIKLAAKLEKAELPLLEKSWQTTLLHDFRNVQRTLDEWEGFVRPNRDVLESLGVGAQDNPVDKIEHFGFWRTYGEKQRAWHAAQAGLPTSEVADWKWRDEIQQRLVSQARRMPYELPAMYLSQRAVVDKLTGTEPKNKAHWYNPIDVLGDFAQQSVMNLATMMVPWEVGQASTSHGWNKLMTYGDFASSVPHANLKQFSVGMRSILDMVGQSSSEMIYKTIQKSQQSRGAFSNAITQGVFEHRDLDVKGATIDREFKKQGRKFITNKSSEGLFATTFPKLRGMLAGFREGWHDEGLNLRNAEAILNGDTHFEYAGQTHRADPGQVRTSRSDIEQIALVTQNLVGKGTSADIVRGNFGGMRKRDEYRRMLMGNLQRAGVSEEDSFKVARQLKINLPFKKEGNVDSRVSRRIDFEDTIHRYDNSEKEYLQAVNRRLSGIVGSGHARAIADALPDAVSRADRAFTDIGTTRRINAQIRSEWSQIYNKIFIPYAKERLPENKLGAEMFGEHMTQDAKELLIRKAAERVGLPILNKEGHPFSTSVLRDDLRKLGFNVRDQYDLRGYLMDRGVISKPWHQYGFGALGLRRFSAEEAHRRGYFGAEQNEQVGNLLRDIHQTDPFIGGMGSRRVGNWVWETRSGNVVDLTALRRSGRTAANVASDNFQIPLIHIRPLNLGFYGASRKMAEKAIIQVESGFSGQEFMGGDGNDFTSLFWLRHRGSTGKVVGHSLKRGAVDLGIYHPGSTDRYSLLGRHARFALGDKGQYSPPGTDRRSQAARFLSLDQDQPHSFLGWIQRGRKRFEDYRNPATSARRFLHEPLPSELSVQQAEGFEGLVDKLRTIGLPPRVASELIKKNPEFASLFKFEDPALGVVKDISRVNTPEAMLRIARALIQKDEAFVADLEGGNAEQIARGVRRAQVPLKRRYLEHAEEPNYFDRPSAQAMRSTGIHRRLDEFRADLIRYATASEAVKSGQGEDLIEKLLNSLEDLRTKKFIGGGEYIEGRAAILSMQVNYLSLEAFDPTGSTRKRYANIMRGVLSSSGSRAALQDIADYEPDVLHEGFPRNRIYKKLRQKYGRAKYQYPGEEYNPFGDKQTVFLPTFGTAYKRSGRRAVASVAGLNTWSNPDAFSFPAIPGSHFVQRLNRYFGTLGLGVKETDFKGPLDFYARGLVGKRIFPAVVAGTAAMTLDRELGGLVYGKDNNGNRIYRPLVTGGIASGIAHAQMIAAGIIPGGQTYQQKREELLYGEVPIRKGRWWPLGNQPWKGGRVQYYRPSWYKRFTSGYLYTPQTYGSPAERALYGYDFSPGRLVSPYHYEKKHYNDRPYPVTGEYFSGPWGPLTSALNLTLGRILKPPRIMHKQELSQALTDYQRVGEFGMAPINYGGAYPTVLTRSQTGGQSLYASRTAGDILGLQSVNYGGGGGGAGYAQAYSQPYGFVGVPYGTNPSAAAASYYQAPHPLDLGSLGRSLISGALTGGALSSVGTEYLRQRGTAGAAARQDLANVNARYSSRAGSPLRRAQGLSPYNRVILTNPEGFSPRLVPAATPMKQGSYAYTASHFGYETHEMLGIYGFLAGAAKESLGFGSHDFTPKRPVLTSASRAYGSERSFWDLNLGGAGDLPNMSEGDYGNLEFSEIARRFIPHRRRDTNEINPIPNQLGQQYPWLAGSNYFLNFHQGDPYSLIQEGEMRLPGAGYERLHSLHPDVTGNYGLVDQHAILGDSAPWSAQYKALDQVLDKMTLSPEQKAIVQRTRKQVATVKKRVDFHPYLYSNTKFQTDNAKVLGFAPGEADIIETTKGPIRFAGVRARNVKEAYTYAHQLVTPGQNVSLMYDANRPIGAGALDAIVTTSTGVNVNKQLLNSDYGYESRRQTALDYAVNRNVAPTALHRLLEKIAHRNTLLNTKFLPDRTAVEDWERLHVYGTDFPQWTHPVRDFLKPLGYRATNRNPVVAALALGTAGSVFATNPQAKTALRLVGGITGFGLASLSNAKSFETGHRFIPTNRVKEMGVDEYTDILNYVKYSRLYASAREEAQTYEGTDPEAIARQVENSKYKQFQYTNLGPATAKALEFRKDTQQTLYGADVYGDVMNLSAAIPKRKRDHFLEFLNAPLSDRQRILSTAPRLERRIYEARWGLKVERRPDLVQYFSEHELPGPDWEGWCVLPDEEILTPDGLSIAAESLDIGQSVYSIFDGTITDKFMRKVKEEEIISLKINNGVYLRATSNHLVLVPSLPKCINLRRFRDRKTPRPCIPTNSIICQECSEGSLADINFQWKSMDSIMKGEYLAFPRYRSREDFKKVSYKGTTINLTWDLCFVLGLFLAEGHIIWDESLKRKPRGIGFTFGQEEYDFAQETKRVLESVFGVHAWMTWRDRESGNSIEVECKQVDLGELFYELCGRHSDKKRLNSGLMNLPIELTRGLLAGVMAGDGSKEEGIRLQLSLTSKEVVFQTWLLCMWLGIPALFRQVNRPKGRKPQWNCGLLWNDYLSLYMDNYPIPTDPVVNIQGSQLIVGEWVFRRVEKVEVFNYTGSVYDFSASPLQAYCGVAGVYHNSPSVPTDAIRIKIAQSQGLDVSQMGYFPQQAQEANLINVSYPDFSVHNSAHATAARLRQLMASQGISGDVRVAPSAFPGSRVQLNAGVVG